MSEVKKIIIQEWDEEILPDDLGWDTEFLNRLLDLSNIFEVKLKPERKVAIRAQGYVGVFNLKDSKGRDVTIIVKPKMNITNLVWMIAVSEAKNFKEIKEIENLISIPGNDEDDIGLPIIRVIKRYFERLSGALTYGFLEMPRAEVREEIVIRGRILSSLLSKTLFSSPSPRIAYEVQYYTADNPVNRYILDTAYMLYREKFQLLKVINVSKYLNIIFKAMLELGYNPSLSTTNVNIHDLLLLVPLDRPYISELLKLSEIIRKWLKNEQLSYLKDVMKVPALYINMNDLFESFVRKVMIMAANRLRETKGIEITAKKAEGNRQALVTRPEPKAYLVPDIVIEVKGKPVAVGDVKYKVDKDPLKSGPEGDRESVYQVYTYMHGWNVNKGFLVYPSTKEGSFYEPYILKGGKELYIVKIAINKSLETSEKVENSELFAKLSELLERLIV